MVMLGTTMPNSEAEIFASLDRSESTSVPREPCAAWLPSLAGRTVEGAVCGGQHIAVLTSGEHIGQALRKTLWRTALSTGSKAGEDDSSSDGLDPDDDSDGRRSKGLQKGAIDMAIIAAGRLLYAHRVVVARRSSVLRELIVQEERPGDDVLLEFCCQNSITMQRAPCWSSSIRTTSKQPWLTAAF